MLDRNMAEFFLSLLLVVLVDLHFHDVVSSLLGSEKELTAWRSFFSSAEILCVQREKLLRRLNFCLYYEGFTFFTMHIYYWDTIVMLSFMAILVVDYASLHSLLHFWCSLSDSSFKLSKREII